MNISVLGCGRWGSCIAWYLDKIGHNVLSCGLADAPEFIQLKETHKNDYLTFPKSIEVSSDLKYAIERAEVIIISISSQYLRSYFADISKYNLEGKTIVLCMKGVEATTGKRLSEVVGEFVDESKTPVAVWVGPGHPQDYVRGIPNCMVIDSNNHDIKEKLVNEFTSDLIRFYLGTDLIGSEIGAAAKNVIGIAAGMLDGLNYTSLKGALMARGTREIARLIKGHMMGGFGGALKNISIGIASAHGKAHIHGVGVPEELWTADHNSFLECMADAAKSVVEYLGRRNTAFINVANRLSVDCDCDAHPHEPEMADIGVFASLDPVALDQACVDAVYASPDPGKATLIERMESRNGIHTVETACALGIGVREYELIYLD